MHSPLVGPLTMVPLGDELRRRGWTVMVPDLRPALSASRLRWDAIVEIAADASASPDVIVGHSGAGVVLPLLAERLSPEVVVFVDALVPELGQRFEPSPAFIEFVDALAADGPLLPPWHQWWGAETMAQLIPDPAQRGRIAAEIPRVPRAFYDEWVSLPPGWHARHRCCFLQLSPAYDDDRQRAEAFGWRTRVLAGRHLDVASRSRAVCDTLLDLVQNGPSP